MLLEGSSLNDFATALLVRLRRDGDAWRFSPRQRRAPAGDPRQAARARCSSAAARSSAPGPTRRLGRHELDSRRRETLVLATDGWFEAGPAETHVGPEELAAMAHSLRRPRARRDDRVPAPGRDLAAAAGCCATTSSCSRSGPAAAAPEPPRARSSPPPARRAAARSGCGASGRCRPGRRRSPCGRRRCRSSRRGSVTPAASRSARVASTSSTWSAIGWVLGSKSRPIAAASITWSVRLPVSNSPPSDFAVVDRALEPEQPAVELGARLEVADEDGDEVGAGDGGAAHRGALYTRASAPTRNFGPLYKHGKPARPPPSPT